MFNENATIFNNQRVKDFDAKKGIVDPAITYRIRTDWDIETDADVFFKKFLEDPKLPEIKNFIIGLWERDACDVPPQKMVNLIIEYKDKLQHIKGIFFGDITYEENEVSWIENTNQGVILDALPNLEIFQIRGGNNLSLGKLNHPNLKKLIIETGGMSKNVFQELSTANLPKLEHLELWIGTENYGFDATAEEVAAAYRGKNDNHLPALKYLGLRNNELADESAKLLVGDPVMDKIEVLDLSKGILGDVGAEALVNNPKIRNLKKLDLHHNFISDEWATRLDSLGIQINLDEREPDADEDDRYVEVGE